MNRSASEWAFQQFLREEVDKGEGKGKEEEEEEEKEAKEELKKKKRNGMASSFNGCLHNNNNVHVGLEEYQAFLKNKLNLACAAVAMSRAFFVKPQDSAARADSGSLASNTPQLGSEAASKVGGIPSLPNGQKKSGSQVRPSTSGSSRELSEEDEVDGENETMENMDPADAKHDTFQ